MSTPPVEVSRFNLPSTAAPNERLPLITHVGSEFTIEESSASRQEARERLARDVEAKP